MKSLWVIEKLLRGRTHFNPASPIPCASPAAPLSEKAVVPSFAPLILSCRRLSISGCRYRRCTTHWFLLAVQKRLREHIIRIRVNLNEPIFELKLQWNPPQTFLLFSSLNTWTSESQLTKRGDRNQSFSHRFHHQILQNILFFSAQCASDMLFSTRDALFTW